MEARKIYNADIALVVNTRLVAKHRNWITMTSTLRTLAHAILSGIDTIEDLYSKAGVPLPSLNSLFSPSSLDKDDALGDAQRLVAGAAAQIIATTRQPMEYIQESTFSGMYTTASLGFVVEVDIPDLLKEAGPQVS